MMMRIVSERSEEGRGQKSRGRNQKLDYSVDFLGLPLRRSDRQRHHQEILYYIVVVVGVVHNVLAIRPGVCCVQDDIHNEMAKVTTQSERIALSRRDGSDEQGRGRPKDFEEKKVRQKDSNP